MNHSIWTYFDRSPNYEHLRNFDCFCYMKNVFKLKDKFESCIEKYIFIGYPQLQIGWKTYNDQTRVCYTFRDVVFYEHIYPCIQQKVKIGLNDTIHAFNDEINSIEEEKNINDNVQDHTKETHNVYQFLVNFIISSDTSHGNEQIENIVAEHYNIELIYQGGTTND